MKKTRFLEKPEIIPVKAQKQCLQVIIGNILSCRLTKKEKCVMCGMGGQERFCSHPLVGGHLRLEGKAPGDLQQPVKPLRQVRSEKNSPALISVAELFCLDYYCSTQ